MVIEIQPLDTGYLVKFGDGRKGAISRPEDLANAIYSVLADSMTEVKNAMAANQPGTVVAIGITVDTGLIADDDANTKKLVDALIEKLKSGKQVTKDEVIDQLKNIGGERSLGGGRVIEHDKSQNSQKRFDDTKDNKNVSVNASVQAGKVIVTNNDLAVKHDDSKNSGSRDTGKSYPGQRSLG